MRSRKSSPSRPVPALVARAFRGLRELLAPSDLPARSGPSPFTQLVELEDRALFSATPLAVLDPRLTLALQTQPANPAVPAKQAAVVPSVAAGAALASPQANPTANAISPGGSSSVAVTNPIPDRTAVRQELVIIDPSTPDYRQLAQDILAQATPGRQLSVVILDAGRNGLEQITDILAGYSHLDAVHIISHGEPGEIELGHGWVRSADLTLYEHDMREWGAALNPGADLLFYGCDLAANAAGRHFLQQIHDLTGAQVAASTDATGAADLGGNWKLEYATGNIAVPSLADPGWENTLGISPVSAETLVNVTTAGSQQLLPNSNRSVARSATGNYVVTWAGPDANGLGVYARLYSAAGVPLTGEFQVNTTTAGDQTHPVVAMDGSGNFAIAWASQNQDGNGWGVYTRLYNAAGVAQTGETLVNQTTAGNQFDPSIAMQSAGNYVITWTTDQNGVSSDIFARSIRPNGTPEPNEYKVNTTSANLQNSAVAMDATGDFVVVWRSNQVGGQQIFGQRFTNPGSTATRVGSEFQISTGGMAQQDPSVAIDATGNFTVAWSSNQTTPREIFARSYNASGAALGGEFAVSTGTTSGDARNPSLAYTPTGTVLATWVIINGNSSLTGVYAQEFRTDGTTVGGTLRVSTTTGYQQAPSVAADGAGNFSVVWSGTGTGDPDGVFSRNYATSLNSSGITVTGSTLLVIEDNNVVRVNATTGAVLATYATGVANDGLAVGPDGSLYVADYYYNRILHFDPTGAPLPSFHTTNTPQGLAFGPDGNLYVTTSSSTVEKYTPAGVSLGTFITAGSGGLWNAKAIVWGPDGNAYVSSYFNSEVLRYNGTTGAFLNVFATGSGGFEDITFGPDGNLYAASYGNGTVYRYNGTTGLSLGTFASGITTAYGLRFDPAGNLDVTSRSDGQIKTFNGSTGAFMGNLDTSLTNPAYMIAPTSLVTSEAGTTANFSVVLNTLPTSDVTITLNSSMPGQGSLSQTTLVFTPLNWNVAQTVTVTGLPDGQFDGDQVYQITGTAASADGNYNGLTLAPVVVVNKEAEVATSTAVVSSRNPSTYGQAVTFTATASTSGHGTPTGTVTFFDGTANLGTVALSGGTARLTTSTLAAGTHTILADYNGSGLFLSSVSGSLTETVNQAALTVTAANATKVYGQANPGFTCSLTGFVNGDTSAVVSGSASLTTTATASSGVGTYTITAARGTLSAANYTFVFQGGALTVTPATLTVTANAATKVYGQANPAFTAGYSGFVNGDTSGVLSGSPSLTTTATASSGVGAYAITPARGTLSATNYTFSFVNGTLNVTPATLTVTANNATKVYGQSNPNFTATYSGFVNGDTTAVLSGSPSLNTAANTSSGVGTYAVTAAQGSLNAANYTFTFQAGTLSVTPASLTVTADDTSKTQGQPNPAFTASYSGFVHGDNPSSLSGTLTFTTSATAASPAGTYPVTPGGLSSADYTIAFVSGTLTVTAGLAASSVSLVSSVNPSTYGQAVSFTATVSALGTPTGTVIFADGSTTLCSVSLSGGTAVFSTSALGAGLHDVTARYGGDSSFASSTSADLYQTVNPATLTVTAANAAKVYGQANPSFSASYSGFVNGDTAAVLGGSPGLTTTATVSSGVGAYAITAAQGTLSATNYTFAFQNGTLTVIPATLSVSADNAARVYGQANPAFTASYSGFVNGDTAASLSGSPSLSSTATTSSGVGTYTITAGQGTLNAANYTFAMQNGTLTVTPATLTVTADDVSKVYGQANPTLTDTLTGFVNGDSAAAVSGNAGLTTAASPSSAVGTYTITAAQGTLSAANYTFAMQNGTLTVTPATLTVTADDIAKVYGQANPGLTYTLTGFVNSDNATVVSGAANVVTGATASSGVGTYAITASQGTLTAVNYTFAYQGGTLTVTPATLTVTPDDAGKGYGQANPGFTYTLTGFVNGDNATAVSGAPDLNTVATASSGAGAYAITADQGTVSAANYTFAFQDGTLTISPAALTVTANAAARVYGQSNPSFTASYSGFVNGDTAASLGGGPDLSTNVTAGSGVGNYTITAAPGTLNSANYTFTFSDGTLTVTPAPLLVTASQSKVYGAPLPPSTAAYSGFVNSDTAAVLNGNLNLSTAATASSGVGTYTISVAGDLSAANYSVSYADGTLTVTPATLTVTATDAAKVAGQPNPALAANITGYVNGDNAAAVRGSADLSTTVTNGSGPGAYAIQAARGSLNADNYAFTFVNGTFTVRAAPATSSGNGGHSPAVTQGTTANPGGETQFLAEIRQLGTGQASPSAGTGGGDTNQASASSAAGAHASDSPATSAGGTYFLRGAAVGLRDGSSAMPPRAAAALLNRPAPGDLASVELVGSDNSFSVSTRDQTPERSAAFRPNSRLAVTVAENYSPGLAAYDSLPDPYLVRRDLEWEPVAPAGTDEAAAAGVLAASGLIATASYVLLNPRTLAWMLSLLTSQPVWKQFDPLEVIFAWEEDRERGGTPETPDESLFDAAD